MEEYYNLISGQGMFHMKKELYPQDGLRDVPIDELEPLVALAEIGNAQCRWPTTMTHSCGRQTASGKVYCETHEKRAHK